MSCTDGRASEESVGSSSYPQRRSDSQPAAGYAADLALIYNYHYHEGVAVTTEEDLT
jgi:hypothetical protein